MLICLDPGHGGADSGAVGNGLREKDLTLDIASRIAARLREHGFSVLMTRTDDRYVGLSERAQMANNAHASYLLSVHINSDAGQGTGFESYVQPGYDSGETGRIRGVIHAQVAAFFASQGLPDRGRKQADLAVCRETAMPASLHEYGFIDSADAQKLADPAFRQGCAEATVRGLCEAFGVAYVAPGAAPAPQPQPTPAPGYQQWEIDATNWLKSSGLIKSDHDPRETVNIATLGAILHNFHTVIGGK